MIKQCAVALSSKILKTWNSIRIFLFLFYSHFKKSIFLVANMENFMENFNKFFFYYRWIFKNHPSGFKSGQFWNWSKKKLLFLFVKVQSSIDTNIISTKQGSWWAEIKIFLLLDPKTPHEHSNYGHVWVKNFFYSFLIFGSCRAQKILNNVCFKCKFWWKIEKMALILVKKVTF